jgi:hypothetical protein
MEAVMSHDAAHGAMPTLRAATERDAVSGSYFAPERLFQLKGARRIKDDKVQWPQSKR